MKKSMWAMLAACLAILTTSGAARAWDAPQYWYQSDTLGGGGILASGGAGDHNITCANCHIKGGQNYGTVDFKPTFNPPIGTSYKEGQTYQVTVTMTNEHLGFSCMNADGKNKNFFGAAFEDDSGKAVGQLVAGNGGTGNCPPAPPSTGVGNPTTSTFVFQDCHAIIGGGENTGASTTTAWTFSWTAPTGGANVTLYYAGVDGDCMMDSLNDDAKVGTMKLGAGLAMRETPAGGGVLACAFLFPAVGLVTALRRRPRRRSR